MGPVVAYSMCRLQCVKKELCIHRLTWPVKLGTSPYTVCAYPTATWLCIFTIRLSGGSVFIQCVAGVSRSVTITAMYIMLVTSLSHEQALTIIRQCRPQAGPNIGFRTQLKNYYDKYAETERIKIKEKYPHKTLYDEDEKAAQQLLIDAVENPSTLSYK
ncbi:dual specificity protein phosphatase 22-B-like isoform X2 [Dysidea avara]|uniref:dual specificity protein phosphatase 22-B-like isoform X2 n=1 Tax=Dysidea avara TaxID=196820 RepID=UPI00331880B4